MVVETAEWVWVAALATAPSVEAVGWVGRLATAPSVDWAATQTRMVHLLHHSPSDEVMPASDSRQEMAETHSQVGLEEGWVVQKLVQKARLEPHQGQATIHQEVCG